MTGRSTTSTGNELYSYEYLRRVFGLSADANDLSDAEIKEHPMVVVGSPDECVAKLEHFDAIGVDQVLCFKQCGSIPHANIMRSLDRMAKYIFPYFNPHAVTASEEIAVAGS